jgi:hypothetical protein
MGPSAAIRHIDYFRASGKYVVAWMKQGGEKEYYLATACSEIYSPPTAYLSLRGFVTGGAHSDPQRPTATRSDPQRPAPTACPALRAKSQTLPADTLGGIRG